MEKLAVGPELRLLTAAAGVGLVAAAARRRTVLDTILGIGGFGLVLWAFVSPAPQAERAADIVDIASEESFPASDSPAW